jgi:hypothetical protein
LQVKAAKTVIAGLVLLTSSLVQVVLLLDRTAGLAKAPLDPSTQLPTELQVAAVVISEAVATAVEEVEEAIVEALLAALATDSGRMACTSQVHRT